jgi:hypothetical protein
MHEFENSQVRRFKARIVRFVTNAWKEAKNMKSLADTLYAAEFPARPHSEPSRRLRRRHLPVRSPPRNTRAKLANHPSTHLDGFQLAQLARRPAGNTTQPAIQSAKTIYETRFSFSSACWLHRLFFDFYL